MFILLNERTLTTNFYDGYKRSEEILEEKLKIFNHFTVNMVHGFLCFWYYFGRTTQHNKIFWV